MAYNPRKYSFLRPRMPEHDRRTIMNRAMPADLQDWVYPDDDPDMQVKVPYGPHQGRTLGELLESLPQYLAYLTGPRVSHVKSEFTTALFRVAARYRDRIGGAK